MTNKKILIATGGTGGHIFPAYSLANYLKKKNYELKLTVDNRGLKYLTNTNNLSLIKIPSTPFKKENIFKFFISLFINVYSIIFSFFFLLFYRPAIIFGTGGYSSFPICIAASILRIKFIIYENNLIIGKTNRYLLPFAKKIFVSYEDLEGIPSKYSSKVYKVGNILRQEIINSNFIAYEKNKFETIQILVLGGSQAAKVFGDELPLIFKKLKNSHIPIKIFQQCLSIQKDQLKEFYKKLNIECEIFNFTNNIIDYYSKANLVITRSGASVLGELINVKVPFIAIPLPSSADNHQYKNDEFYKKKGYGYLLEEKEIKNKLYDLINSIFRDKIIIKKILSKQEQHSDKYIFQNLESQIENILNEKD